MRASADDPAGDRPDGAPGDAHQLDHRRLRGVRDEPGDLIIERSGVPGAVTGPRHRGHRHPVLGTVHPWRVGLDEHADRAGIQRPPAAPSLTLVVTAATPTTAPAAASHPAAQPARHDDLADRHRRTRPPRRPRRGRRRSPAPIPSSIAPRSPSLSFQPSTAGKPSRATGCTRGWSATHPRIGSESHKCCEQNRDQGDTNGQGRRQRDAVRCPSGPSRRRHSGT